MSLERRLLSVLLWPVHRAVLRASGGRLGMHRPARDRVGILVLATTGRRSGERRERPIYYIEDGDRYVLVASNVGDDRHPDWWLNLLAHPEAEVNVGAGWVPVRAREAGGVERERLWPELVRRFSGFARYARRTDRPIPVVVLEAGAAAE